MDLLVTLTMLLSNGHMTYDWPLQSLTLFVLYKYV